MQRFRRLSLFDRPITLEVAVSVVLVVLLGTRISFFPFAPIAGLIGVALLPALITDIRRYHLMTLLTVLLAVSVASGAALTWFTSATHETSNYALFERSIMVITMIGGVAVLLFARTHIGTGPTAIAYGAGLFGAIALDPISSSNPWRFTFSLPVAVLVLAILSLRSKLLPQLIALVGLGVIGVLNDARSNSAILFLAAVVLLWQRLAQAASRGRRRAGHIIGLLLFSAGFFQLMQFSLLEGYFGEATQAKTEAQIATGGGLLLGGRPEAAASFALIRLYPFGLGSGVLPTGSDVYEAKSAMSAIGYDPNNGYVERFMFGSGITLHSVLGEFWIWFGFVGLAACITMIAIIGWGLERHLRNATLTGLLAFLSLRFFWDLLFSPTASTMKLLTLTLPLAALLIVSARSSGRRRRSPYEIDVATMDARSG